MARNYQDFYNKVVTKKGEEVFKVDDLSSKIGQNNNAYSPSGVSFSLSQGEVLGVSGLVGAGRTEIIRTIFGDLPKTSGRIFVKGEEVFIRNSSDAMKIGLAWISEDRKQEGLVLSHSIFSNISLPVINKFSKKGL